MNDEELLALSKEILSRVEKGEGHQDLRLVQMQMLRLIAHVRSEQRVAKNMANEMKLLSDAIFGSKSRPEEMPGIINVLREVKDSIALNRKMHAAIASGMLALIAKSLWELITKGHP